MYANIFIRQKYDMCVRKAFYLFRIKSYLHKSHKEKEDCVKIEIVVTAIASKHGQHETRQVDK